MEGLFGQNKEAGSTSRTVSNGACAMARRRIPAELQPSGYQVRRAMVWCEEKIRRAS